MQVRRYLWLTVMLLGCVAAACAGGSGSSGFDTFPSSENAAIMQALDEQRCVAHNGLTICPAEETMNSPTPTRTATPTEGAFFPPPATPTRASAPSPATTATRSGAPTRTPTVARVLNSPTPTATEKPAVGTGLSDTTTIACTQQEQSGECSFTLPFTPQGFPESAVFRIAVRLNGRGHWTVGPELASTGTAPTASLDAPVSVAAPVTGAPGGVEVQIAILAFLEPPATTSTNVDELAQTGADFAFVTTALTLEPVT